MPHSPERDATVSGGLSDEGRLHRALRESEERLRLAIEAGKMAVWEVDHASGEVTGSPELNHLLGLPQSARPSLADVRALYAPGVLERLAGERVTYEAIVADRAAGRWDPASGPGGPTPVQVEFEIVTPAGERKVLLLRARHVPALHGAGLRTTGVLVDITERKRAEEMLGLVAHEMRHRVKNLLSIVQSIAAQTIARQREDEASAAFMGRLRSLSSAMDVILTEDVRPAQLRPIVERVLEPFSDPDARRFRIGGPEVSLSARGATAFAMIVHELCTNAIKYGALSVPDGWVELEWSLDAGELTMRWKERGGPQVVAPAQRGFGGRLLATALGAGSVDIAYEPDGLACRIAFRLDA
jgi:two-component sensor histidine kinase